MGGRGCLPRELLARRLGSFPGPGQRGRVSQQALQRCGHALDVSRLDDRAGAESADDLSETPDVVDDRRNAGPERLQQGAGDVDLGSVRKEGDRRLGERAPQFRVREKAEAPLGAIAGCLHQPVEGDSRVPCDEESNAVRAEDGLDRVLDALVWPNEPEHERRATVVLAGDLGAKGGMSDHAQPLVEDAELNQRFPASLRVHHDAVEALEELLPEALLRGGSSRDDVVGREDGRRPRAKKPPVGLGGAQPLHVHDVGTQQREPGHPEGMLDRLHRKPKPRRPHAGGEGVEPFALAEADGRSDVAEAEVRRDELDVGTGGGKCPRERPIVGRRVGGRVGEDDAHRRNVRRGAVTIPRVTFEEARAQFPVLERIAYLQAGSVGPLGRPSVEAMHAEEERNLQTGRAGKEYIDRILTLRAELRASVGALVGVEPDQVALTSSTTDGCNIVLAGLDLRPEDEVVTTTDEHFGLLGPLHMSGARVVVVPPDPDRIVAAVTPRTRLLAVSQVLWTTGQVLPVHELRERTGLPILVDGAQSVGAIAVAARGLEFFTVSGQKWLCGPEATGALVVSDPERLRVARPSYFSQQGYEPNGAFTPWPDARRFDPMWVPSGLMAGLQAAIDLRPEWSFERAALMAQRCRKLLREAGADVVVPADRATLVSWRVHDEEPEVVVQRLAAAGVSVRDLPGTGLVRASVGWWTSDEDLARLVAAL